MERSGHVVLTDLKDPTSSAVSGLTLSRMLQPVYSSCFLCLLLQNSLNPSSTISSCSCHETWTFLLSVMLCCVSWRCLGTTLSPSMLSMYVHGRTDNSHDRSRPENTFHFCFFLPSSQLHDKPKQQVKDILRCLCVIWRFTFQLICRVQLCVILGECLLVCHINSLLLC